MSESDSNETVLIRKLPVKKLITLVNERQCLWDRSASDYKSRRAKDEAWQEIYDIIDSDYKHMNETHKIKFGNKVTRKWYNIRDTYVKSRKDYSRNKSRPYVYADLLAFLDPVCFGEAAVTRKPRLPPEETVYNAEDEPETTEWLDVDLDEEPLEKRAKISLVDQEQRGVNETDDSIVAVLASLIQREEDEDRAFFKSITPTVKKLSESAKFKFRIKVMKLLDELKKRDSKALTMKQEILSENESNSD